jgi:competence protein ComEC
LLIFFVIPDQIYQPHELELYFLDVGQGDSIIAVFPGGDALLVDGGGAYYGDFETGRQIVLPFVLEKRIKIRWMAVSHFHPDHVNGIVEILPILKPKEIWLATILNTQPIYKALCSRAGKNTLIRHINCGYKMQINSCHVECLYPFTVLNKEKAENNDSMVLKISNATHSFLLTGDIEKQTEFKLLKHHPDKLSADVLKIPHHGSKTSSSINFLQTIAPRLAIISCGAENHFGFPHRQVLDNLKKTKTPCLTTAFQGGISVTSAKTKLIISVSK